MQKILILTNSINGLYSFRRELVEELVQNKFNVIISAPNDTKTSYFINLGCTIIDTKISRRGINPVSDFKLLYKYFRIINKINPDKVLSYTIKPNIYGGIVCRLKSVSQIANITGLGTAIENKGIMRNITLILYKIGLKKSKCIFFQNKDNMHFLQSNDIGVNNGRLIPGSGVNIREHEFETYPSDRGSIKILFIGRLMKAKGIEELFNAIEIVKERYPTVEFHVVGGREENYDTVINNLVNAKLISYHGSQPDVHEYIKDSHAIINPSHHEGMSNVLLEAASTGRPVLASDIPGCRETFDEGLSGLGFTVKNVNSIVETVVDFLKLSYEEKKKMGAAGRKKIENEFNRNIVIDAYLNAIQEDNGG